MFSAVAPLQVATSSPTPARSTLALPWYENEDWPVLHSLFLERDSVSESYGKWLSRALEAERRYTVDGYTVVRVIVRPEPLLDWCNANNRIIDLKARHDYAQELLANA